MLWSLKREREERRKGRGCHTGRREADEAKLLPPCQPQEPLRPPPIGRLAQRPTTLIRDAGHPQVGGAPPLLTDFHHGRLFWCFWKLPTPQAVQPAPRRATCTGSGGQPQAGGSPPQGAPSSPGPQPQGLLGWPQEARPPAEGRGQERKGRRSPQRRPCLAGNLSLGSLSPFGDCFPGSLEPEEDGMFLSLPRGKAFFFLHKNVKLHNPIENLDRLQLAAWVLLLGTVGRGREMGAEEGEGG